MKKLTGIIAITILLTGSLCATDIMVELKGSYFHPSERAFRDIYGGGLMYGGEVSIRAWKRFYVWLGASSFSKKGELTFTKEETKLRITPIGGGIKYLYPLKEKIDIYGGLGINRYSYEEENFLGKASKSGWGAVLRAGGLIKVKKGFIIDVFINYSYCRMKPADYRINIGGIEAGIGLGYKF